MATGVLPPQPMLRFALRQLVRKPAFTVLILLTLALGIGANTAIFSVANALFLRPLPYPDAGRLAEVLEAAGQVRGMPVDYPNFAYWRHQARTIESAAIFQNRGMNLTGFAQPEQLDGAYVSASFFPTLGIQPALGRDFRPEEDRRHAPLAAIVSHALWQNRFDGDPGLIGQTLRLNGRPHTIIGVLPRGFRFYRPADVYVPIEAGAEPLIFKHGVRDATVAIARRRAGIPPEAVEAELDGLYRRLEPEAPEFNRGVRAAVTPLRDCVAGSAGTPVLVLLAAVGLLLLIGCVNVAHLLLARSSERSNEMAIRAALGAGRGHIVRQLLTESLLLSLAGAAAGILLAAWSLDGLRKFVPADLSLAGLAIDARVLAFTLLVSVVAAVLFGLAPALAASKTNLTESLRDGARTTGGRGRRRLGRMLVTAEVALALVLLIGAGLLIRSFARLMGVDPGIRPGNVLTMRLTLPLEKYGRQPGFVSFWDQVLGRVRALPGIEAAGFTTSLPFSGSNQGAGIVIAGRPAPSGGALDAGFHAVSAGYFRAMGIPLLRGRYLEDRDTGPSSPVAVINETMARRYWSGQDPVGNRIHLGPLSVDSAWMTVVGVVGDTRHFGLHHEPAPEYYFSALQLGPWSAPTLVVRTRSNPISFAPAVRAAITAVDREQPVVAVRAMEEYLSGSVAPNRANTILLGLFAAAALLLAGVGVYGVVASSVARRTQEIGVRVALGAARGVVLRLVLGQAIAPVLGGIALGLAAAFALTRLLASMLYGVTPTDPLTLAAASLLLVAIALAASYLPARRAAALDPLTALRYQ